MGSKRYMKKNVITGIVGVGIFFLIVIGIVYVIYSNSNAEVSVSAQPKVYTLCNVDDDCIHIIAVDESGSPELEPLTFQDCINKNYKNYQDSNLFRHEYGTIIEETGKDLCKCMQIEELKMCIFD